jgi:protein-disulfide isomerase
MELVSNLPKEVMEMKKMHIRTAFCVMLALACSAWGTAQATVSTHLSVAKAPTQSSASSSVSAAGSQVNADRAPIAIVDGQPIFKRDLTGATAAKLLQIRQQEYEAESQALDALIRKRMVEIEARKQGITVEQLYQKEVDSKIADPSDAEVKGYYLAVKSRTTQPLATLEPQIKRLMKQAQIQEAREQYADSLRARTEVAILLQPPTVDTGENDSTRIKGDPNAPITIVEFGDYQCPYCGRAESTVENLLKKYKGKVKLAFRDFPLSAIHPFAEGAAEASRCAGAQDKFWPMHDAMYANQSKLTEDDLIKTASGLGMNEESFSSCLKAGTFKAAIQKDMEVGQKAGVNGTPAFFINGRFLNGSVPEEQFEEIINSELATLKNQNSTMAAR